MKTTFLALFALIALLSAGAFSGAQTAKSQEHFAVTHSDAEWKKMLSPAAYKILRHANTEAAYSGIYWDNHEAGAYYCAGCGQELFSSKNKFDSHTGWPSFWKAVKGSTINRVDNSGGMKRSEIICSRCGGHLGHVFDDGPQPTGLRYCMNSPALKFKKAH